MNRKVTLRSTQFNSLPYCNDWHPTSLYGPTHFQVEIVDQSAIFSVDYSKALSNKIDDHCCYDANRFEELIGEMDEFWIRDEYAQKRFKDWIASIDSEIKKCFLSIKLRQVHLFEGD